MSKKVESIQNSNAVLITDETDDILNRKAFVDKIRQIIEYYADKKQSVSFSIQGTWGCGKSWIINKVYNELYDIQDFDNGGSKYCIFTYNAWDYDYYDEPLISLFISLYKQLNNENAVLIKNEETRKKVESFFAALKNVFIEELKVIPFVENIINFKQDYDTQLENYDNEIRKYDYHFDINQIMEATIKGLNKISEEKSFVLFVDELDRCLPEYAIKVLERIHHIKQYVKNIEIIYSIDKNQLKQTINNCFGNSNENMIKNYLSKFIEFGLTVPPATFNKEIEKKYNELFEQFDFINCERNINIAEKIKSILPETIPIRIQQTFIKKIIFINNQLNKSTKKLDYSILITELFIAIACELKMDWKGSFFVYDQERNGVIIKNNTLSKDCHHPEEVNDFILKISSPDIFVYDYSRFGDKKIWVKILARDAAVNSLVIYYIARLLGSDEFYSHSSISYLCNNDKYLKEFFDYYNSLEL